MRILTSFLFVVTSFLTAFAGDGYRRTWDFTKGFSESTLAVMAQDSEHWTVQNTGFQNVVQSSTTAMMGYNGEEMPVPELEGLELGGLGYAAHVQIWDGKSNNTSFPANTACLWINGNKAARDYVSFTVPAGENVRIGYCSHSATQARGFKVSEGFTDEEGNTTFTSMADGTIQEVNLINFNAEESTLKLTSTSGHHIYYIIIGEGDEETEGDTEVKPAIKPAFACQYKDLKTVVTISSFYENATIHYTLDGSEPTTASAIYAEPLVITETGITVKALVALEGYTPSLVSECEVLIFRQAASPVVSIQGNGRTEDAIITLASADAGADIYYNFIGSDKIVESSKYDGPITIPVTATITAFAVNENAGLVQSEPTTVEVWANTAKIRRDELAHFQVNGAGWNTLENLMLDGEPVQYWANGSNYYFSWGKRAAESYENIGEPKVDENGDFLIDENGNFVYEKVLKPLSVVTNSADPDWRLVSRGQVMIYQGNTLSTNVGDGGGYNPERAEDYIEQLGTTGDIQFGGVAAGDNRTGAIESTKKFIGPFNVVAIIVNIGSGGQLAVEVSKDGETWTQIGDTLRTSTTRRLYKRFEVSYEGTDEVFVRVASVKGSSQAVHDIYVFNHGEKSAAMEEEYAGNPPVIANYSFSLSDISVFSGSSFSFPVSMTNENGITAFQCDVYLPEGLMLNWNDEGEYDVVLNADRKATTHSMTASLQPDGAIRIVSYSSANKLFKGNEGELFTLNLTALDGCAENQKVEIRNIRLSTPDQQEYLLPNVSSTVSVKSYTPADANGDGEVTIVDVVAVVNALMGDFSGNFVFDAADMDQNGEITIVDVVAVVNALMGGDVQALGARSILRSNLHVEDAEVNAGESTTLYVKLDNAQAYTAMQMDMNLPEGLTIEGVEMVGDASHTVTYNEEGRIAAYSLGNSRFHGGEALMAITVKADDSFTGAANVDFTNVRVVSTDIVETVLADALSTVIGGAKSIDGVEADENVQILYYSTTGAVSDAPHKGLNIIKRIWLDGRVEVSKKMNK